MYVKQIKTINLIMSSIALEGIKISQRYTKKNVNKIEYTLPGPCRYKHLLNKSNSNKF